jgi:2,3-diaminopropionate biosynthesis protein SbnA
MRAGDNMTPVLANAGRQVKKGFADLVGNTPLVRLVNAELPDIELMAKLELLNPTGSTKDRAAGFILDRVLADRSISASTQIIESSSGNFGVALSAACRARGLAFTCVVDPLVQPLNEYLIKQLGGRLVKVTEADPSGGYLQTRISAVQALCKAARDAYWINQYANPLNAAAYEVLGHELCDAVEGLDYVFIGVSSGGTITGVSRCIKERFARTRVIAVDMVGSAIFGGPTRKRAIPGIGSSIVPVILASATIDDVVHVDERETILACRELLAAHSLFCGGSSGSVLAAVKKFFRARRPVRGRRPRVAMILADRGDRYANTIYNDEWSAPYLDTGEMDHHAVSE